VERRLLVAKDVYVDLRVKVVLDERVYIVAEEVKYVDADDKGHCIKRGAILMANRSARQGLVKFWTYNNGIFDALRATGEHIPSTEAQDLNDLEVSSASLDIILAMTWVVRKTSSPSEREEVRGHLLDFVQRWHRWQAKFKIEALDLATRAEQSWEAIPYTALSPMIWAAERRLGRRRIEVRKITGRIGQRQTALLLVFDQAWQFRSEVEHELDSMLARFTDGHFAPKSVPGMVKRLERLSNRCGSVSLAPFGRRTFSHVARETAYAAQLLEHGNDAEAKVVMERSLRSLFLLIVKREIVEAMTVVLALRRLKGEIPTVDLGYGIDAIIHSLSLSLDCDFKTPVTERVVALLTHARLALDSDLNGLGVVYAYLRKAQEPL
jgi:hypothetical protein